MEELVSIADYAARIQKSLQSVGRAIIEGEVQDPYQFKSGVVGFTLTDGEVQLPCKYLPWLAGRKPLLYTPAAGDIVRVKVRNPDYWAGGGRLSVNITSVERAGEGDFLLRRQQLIQRLADEGLTDPDKFLPLPDFPRAVGIVSGFDSDAIKDVIRGLGDRMPTIPVICAPSQVQGAGAAQQIISSLETLSRCKEIDVIILARGGGSIQDLSTFDDEGLCRAIRAIDIPVITAIGHTANNPVCNYITHSAFVPRHAADMAVPDHKVLRSEFDGADQSFGRALDQLQHLIEDLELRSKILNPALYLGEFRDTLEDLASDLHHCSEQFLTKKYRRLDLANEAFLVAPLQLENTLQTNAHALERFENASAQAMQRMIEQVDKLGLVLDASDFRRQGWLLAQNESGQAVRSVHDIQQGQDLILHLSDGIAETKVVTIKEDTHE